MSLRPISRSKDLQRLRSEGYNIEVRAGHLLLKEVPYVNDRREVMRGVLVSTLTLNGDIAQPPSDHVAYFAGEYPCNKDGSRIIEIQHQSNTQELAQGVVTNHSFSSKPASGRYNDYYEKMTTYAAILSHPAEALDPTATPRTFRVVVDEVDEGEESVFHYMDTASSRAGIGAVTDKLSGGAVAIVGLGGTGAYVLDLLAKTPLGEIHLYDGDDFLQHNAFRAPGAASNVDLETRPKKVDYYAGIYSRMRKKIFAHPYHIDASNVDELGKANFVFLCLGDGRAKRAIIERLQALGTEFVDCGIGVYYVDEKLAGVVRVTTSTPSKHDHVPRFVTFADVEDNEYATNVQIADLNALAAVLAVVKWKKRRGFYADLEGEHHTTYTIDGNAMANEECQ
jgi:hypothetical protein